jgi:hypothetical protein
MERFCKPGSSTVNESDQRSENVVAGHSSHSQPPSDVKKRKRTTRGAAQAEERQSNPGMTSKPIIKISLVETYS